MLPSWQNCTVLRIENETEITRRFWIRMDDMETFDFKPGQFVTLDLPIHEKPNRRWRSYSIASWPDNTNIFELIIVWLEGGAGTRYLFDEIVVGSTLIARGPQGVFLLPEPLDRDIFFVCTGTGVAPFRSMAHHVLRHNIIHQQIYLIFGCRKFSDCLYREELNKLQEELPAFHYIPTFSREDPGAHRTGYVHDIYEDICGAKRNNGEDHAAWFYLCGWKNMIDEAKQRIQAMGYDRKAIHQELYG